jgi:membrane protease YdiL (CAAX protease family)
MDGAELTANPNGWDPLERVADHPVLLWMLGAFLLAGLIADLWILTTVWRRHRAATLPSIDGVPVKPWGLPEVGLIVAVLCTLLVMAGTVFGWLERRELLDSESLRQAQLLASGFVMDGLGIAAVFLLLRAARIGVGEAFGIRFQGLWRTAGRAAFYLLALLPPVWLCAGLGRMLCEWFGIPVDRQEAVQLFLECESAITRFAIGFIAVVAAPVFEELFFRGLAYPALKQKMGLPAALVLTSLAFGAIHLHAVNFLPLTALAIGLTLAYEVTGNLLVPILMHSLFNSLTVSIMILVRT